jgi:hypothetical protein
LAGGLLTIGCLVLGLSLLRDKDSPRITSYALIAAATINLIGQLCAFILPVIVTITGVLLFIAIAWLGLSIMASLILPKKGSPEKDAPRKDTPRKDTRTIHTSELDWWEVQP